MTDNKAMNDFIRGNRATVPQQPAEPPPAAPQREPGPALYELYLIAPHLLAEPEKPRTALSNAGNGAGTAGLPPTKPNMNSIIRQAAGYE